MKCVLLVLVFVLIFSSFAESRLVTLFEDTEPLLESLVGVAAATIRQQDVFHGSAAIDVISAFSHSHQVCSRCIPGWRYEVVKEPTGRNEIRWIMFAWKKLNGDGIMIQFANNTQWGGGTARYVAGENATGWPAIRVGRDTPSEWQLVIRDLYSDFGSFVLTGVALTPFKGIGLYDSIYLAHNRSTLLSVFEKSIETQVFITAPSRINDGNYFIASVEVADVQDLAAFEMEVTFNPDVVKVKDIAEGDFLSASGTYWLPPDDDNRNGRITEIMCTRLTPGGRCGSGVLFTITFRARDPGKSTIALENVRLVNSEHQLIPVRVRHVSVAVGDFPPWDVNCDGCVDVLDFLFVAQHLGWYIDKTTVPNPDVTGDGWVDDRDLAAVARHYGETYQYPAPAKFRRPVPARFIPDLIDIYYKVSSSNEPDKVTLRLLESLIQNAKKVDITAWAKCKVVP